MKPAEFITVKEANELVLRESQNFGYETIDLSVAIGRILAQDMIADRSVPAFNRVAMDGIAIQYSSPNNVFPSWIIQDIQAAGQAPLELMSVANCIEIMTGASLPIQCDTVIPYENITIMNGVANLKPNVKLNQGQNIHKKASDASKGDILIKSGIRINAGVAQLAASIGLTQILVKKFPKIVVLTTGDETISPELTPHNHQIRRSNDTFINGILAQHQIHVTHFHLNDSVDEIKHHLRKYLQEADAIIMTGGVSKGKFDHLPSIFAELEVDQIFHKIQQRPGKPMWFGKANSGCLVFGFPGNPVSTALCMVRYFVPWLNKSMEQMHEPIFAVLEETIVFDRDLSYFALVNLHNGQNGLIHAQASNGNGSGDFINLASSNAFIELSPNNKPFEKGKLFEIWKY